MASHAQSGEIGFGVNHEMVDFKNARKKNLDLVICEPRTSEVKNRKARSFASLADDFGLSLTEEERVSLAKLPQFVETPVGAVRLALEAKACMTAHVRALPRLYDELNSRDEPTRRSSGEVTICPDDPELRLVENPGQKGVALLAALGDLLASVDGWVHFTLETASKRLESRVHVRIGQPVADDQQVDVASRRVPLLRDGAIDEGRNDVPLERVQRLPKRLRQANGLPDDAGEFLEKG